MIDGITSIRHTGHTSPAPSTEQERNRGTEEQIAAATSPYYASSIQSLAPTPVADTGTQKIAVQPTKTSAANKVKNWFRKLFRMKSERPAQAAAPTENAPTQPRPDDANIPRLSPPELIDGQKMAKATAELNRVYRDSSDLESEIETPTAGSKDQIQFLTYIYLALREEELKQENGFARQQSVLQKHQSNKTLQQKYFDLVEQNHRYHKYANINKWAGAAVTCATVATLGVSVFLTGGLSALGAPIALSSILKGMTSGVGGVLQHKADKNTGEIGTVNLNMRMNSDKMSNGVNELQENNQQITNLWKQIRELLKNHMQAARASLSKT